MLQTSKRSELRIREVHHDDEGAILAAYRELFEGDVDARAPDAPSPESWRWRHHGNPDGARAIVAIEDERVVGLVTGCAQSALLDGEPTWISRVDDIRIAPAKRRSLARRGLVLRMAEAYAEAYGGPARDALAWGFPTPAAWRVSNWYAKAQALRTQFRLIARPEQVRIGPAPRVELERVELFDDDVDPLFARFAEGRGLIAFRDAARLNWRYARRPDRDYERVVARRAGEVVGLAIARRGRFDGGPPAALLCEWIVSPEDSATQNALLAWWIGQGLATRSLELVALAPETSPEWRFFQDRGGFRAVRMRTRFLLAFRAFNRRLRLHWLHRSWHYSLGDTDFV